MDRWVLLVIASVLVIVGAVVVLRREAIAKHSRSRSSPPRLGEAGRTVLARQSSSVVALVGALWILIGGIAAVSAIVGLARG